MANSKIILTFHDDLPLNHRIGFSSSNYGSYFIITHEFTWKTIRAGFGQVTIGTPVFESPGERSAANFIQAFNLDWNFNNSQFTVTREVNVVTIETNFNITMFSDFYCFDNTNPPLNTSNVTAVILNGSQPITIDEVSFSEASTLPCQNVSVNVQTSVLATKIVNPVQVDPNTENPFSFDFLRGQQATITVEDENGNQTSQQIETPSILSPNYFNLQINASPFGGTLSVTNGLVDNGFFLLQLQYSLDNETWQDSNIFSGLVAGNYTVYIRDQFGCAISMTFSVNEFGLQLPYFYISKSNSIRFANRVDFGDAANYKNDENTLSCEVDVPLPWHEVQLFQTADEITTQFKSNYQTNTAKVIRENGSEVSVPVVKKSNYIGNKDSRDARKYSLGNGKMAIYFTTGNIYDFDSGFPTGETHYLNGGLPIWAKSGNYVKLDSEWLLIEDILYDESKNAEIIVVSSNYSGPDVTAIAGTIYNVFDYEIYEFTIDMVDYIAENIKIQIVAEDDNFTNLLFLSEDISVEVKHEDAFAIEYWNDDNTDVFYATGIKHKIRVPYFKRNGDVEESSEVNKTDTTSVLINAQNYEVDEFVFEPVTKEIWRKLMRALSHKNVLIDGIGYVLNGTFETEGPLEDTNLYVLTAKMIKTGGVYNSQREGSIDFNTSSSEIPGLISIGNDGFVRY
jgi:hypothetical protein